MAYSTAEGRQQLLDSLAEAIDEIGYALASLGDAYEQLDNATADKLEEELFGPVQRAYGRAKRTYGAFAERSGLPTRSFGEQSAGLPSTGAKGFIDNATAAISGAGGRLATLQDSPMLLEVGDGELRKGLAEIREVIDNLPHVARELVRRLGR
jgi:ABC-type transporter Mla subunit MlaD